MIKFIVINVNKQYVLIVDFIIIKVNLVYYKKKIVTKSSMRYLNSIVKVMII